MTLFDYGRFCMFDNISKNQGSEFTKSPTQFPTPASEPGGITRLFSETKWSINMPNYHLRENNLSLITPLMELLSDFKDSNDFGWF